MKKFTMMITALVLCWVCGFVAAKPVNINKASAEEIAQALNGVGLSKANAIVTDRKKNGPFKQIDDVARVKGIGSVTIRKNKDLIVIK